MNEKNPIIFDKEGKTGFLIESPKYGHHSVIIDTEDVERVKDYNWYIHYCNGKPHAVQTNLKGNMRGKLLRIHTLITGYKMTDHKNMNVCDNRKSNLRECTQSTNMINKGPSSHNTSGYKGVSRNKKRWGSRITVNKKVRLLGTYDTKEAAAIVYNAHALYYYGEFARLNEITGVNN